ncbi:FAD-dependent oxidoreductase [Streptomyces anandii]|uniref:FAD-dependent oxidoreductase n=1 Tax=Streptomyces anandii TaxID=285454 RepID=UPI00379B547E
MTSTELEQALPTDVLVIGGGPAGTWAAIKAALAGADVVLADKGYTGAAERPHPSAPASGTWTMSPNCARPPWRAGRHSADSSPTGTGWRASSTRRTRAWTNWHASSATPSPSTPRAVSCAATSRGPSTCGASGPGCGGSASASSTTPRRWSF